VNLVSVRSVAIAISVVTVLYILCTSHHPIKSRQHLQSDCMHVPSLESDLVEVNRKFCRVISHWGVGQAPCTCGIINSKFRRYSTE